MKFATIKSLFIAMTILSIICLSVAKRSSRSKSKLTDAGATTALPKLIEYEATLSIKDDTTTATHNIKLDQEAFNQMDYGIQFSMETGAVTNPAFFLVSANTYLFNFKNAHAFNCLNQAMFTHKAMHFSVYMNKKTYDIVFTFPNGWAFGSTVNLGSLCNKFYERWSKTQTKRSELEAEIMKIYSHIKLLKMTRDSNQNNKAGLQTQNAGLDQNIAAMNTTIIAQRAGIAKISADIDVIGQKSAAESAKLDKLEIQTREQEAILTTQQNFIDETNGEVTEIRVITDGEIANEWNSFKVSLQKMINIQSQEDPLKSTLNGYLSNVSGNVARIMSALAL